MLDEHPEAGGGLVGLADRLVEDRARVAEAPREGQAADEDDDDATKPDHGQCDDRVPAGAEGGRERQGRQSEGAAEQPDDGAAAGHAKPPRGDAIHARNLRVSATPDYHRFGPCHA